MKTTAIILPREFAGNVVADEVLAKAARDLREKGTINVTDPEGNTYTAEVFDAEVTEQGLSVTMELDTIPEGLQDAAGMSKSYAIVGGEPE